MRNYGRILQDTIAYASTVENEQERHLLTAYIAQCMRQKNLTWNKDQEAGIARVKADVKLLSDGKLTCDFEGFEEMVQMLGQRKKKK